MGSNNSRRSPNMDSDEDLDHGLGSTSPGQRLGTSSELIGVATYLIRSGQIRFVTPDIDDSDPEDFDSDMEFVGPTRPPLRDTTPDVSTIDTNSIKQQVLIESGRWRPHKRSHLAIPTLAHLMQRRETGMDARYHFTAGDQCLINSRFLPNKFERKASYHHKVFCGTYSRSGDIFLSACQDQHVRIYDTSQNQFELLKTIRARDVGWSVLDVAFSPDSNYLIYSSWSDCIHLCNIRGDHEIHESLPLSPREHSFCIFSLMFSYDNTEIIGGANDSCLYIYDRDSNQRTLKIKAHDDDVNSVVFADNSSQILYSGGDDGLCKVWDRRTLREDNPSPVGVMAGHMDGITYIDSKGDARYFVSNSKDQTIKLWDNRMFSTKEGVEATKKTVSGQRWDYRWQQVPRNMNRKKRLGGDTSVMTYRGHCVLHTLVRCRFSPVHTTGQRYIYTGCATGSIVVYDLLTGKVVKNLEGGHRSCVRDASWHPYQNTIMSSSWDGTVGQWNYYDYWAHEEDSWGEQQKDCDDDDDDDDDNHDGRFRYHTRYQKNMRPRDRLREDRNNCRNFNMLFD